MSDTVIKVENLSKSYEIRHQASRPTGTRSAGERYTALRDVLTNGVKGMGNRLLGRTASASVRAQWRVPSGRGSRRSLSYRRQP